jgi:hypothetical protein
MKGEPAEKISAAVSSELSTRALNERLGGGTHRRRPGSHRYFGKKREAIAWAREEAELDRAIARSESG